MEIRRIDGLKIVFMGTPDFAVPCLEALCDTHEVAAVFTQPDKPKGRKYTLTPPPVKVAALERGVRVFQPKTLKDGEALEIIKNIDPDVIAVVAYGKILPKEILDFPKYGCVNVHASLLPKYRGAAPIQWALMCGESESGVTTMQMDEGLDTGDMLMKSAVKIDENETCDKLHDKLSELGAELIVKTLASLEKGEIIPEKQGESPTPYAAMIDRSLCEIDWNASASEVHNKIRAMSPAPAAITTLGGKRVKIFLSEISDKTGACGEIVSVDPLTVACKTGSVVIKELQLEGKKRMTAKSFLAGRPLKTGSRFGE